MDGWSQHHNNSMARLPCPPACPPACLPPCAVAALIGVEELGAAISLRQPKTAAEWAEVYAAEMREMRRMLQVSVHACIGWLAAWPGLVCLAAC